MNRSNLCAAFLFLVASTAGSAAPVVFVEDWEDDIPGSPLSSPWSVDPHMAAGSLSAIAGSDYNRTPLGNHGLLVNAPGFNGKNAGNQARLVASGLQVLASDATELTVLYSAKGEVTKRSEWYLELSLGDVHAPRLADVGLNNPLPQPIPVIAYCKPALTEGNQHKGMYYFDGRLWMGFGFLDFDQVWQNNIRFSVRSNTTYLHCACNNNPFAVPRQYLGGFDRVSIYTLDCVYADITVLDDLSIIGGNVVHTLGVSPGDGLVSLGAVGGPFSPLSKTYTLTNLGVTAMDWSAAKSQDWLDVSPTSGTLAPQASVNVEVSINALANVQPLGVHTDQVTFTDLAGNLSQTRDVELHAGPLDVFTETFAAQHDLAQLSLTLTPDASPHGYQACTRTVAAFPTNPANGSWVDPGDNGSVKVTLQHGAQVYFYGTAYSEFYVGGNGYITFGGPDTQAIPTLINHFSKPRIAGMLTDLAPTAGQVTSFQLMDRVAVTYRNVAQVGGAGTSSFQIELFFDGRIRLIWLDLSATNFVTGLSRGSGIPVTYASSDLSGYVVCPPARHAADFDGDGDADLSDFGHLQACLGSGQGPIIDLVCADADLDMDANVDGLDTQVFLPCLNGSSQPPVPGCITGGP